MNRNYLPPSEQGPDGSQAELAPVESHSSDGEEDESYEIARFELPNDHRLILSFDADTAEVGWLEEGRVGDGAPVLLTEQATSIAEAYLQVADPRLPVPEELLEDAVDDANLRERLIARKITTSRVEATDVFGSQTRSAAQAKMICGSTYYAWWDWHDAPAPGLVAKEYYVSTFYGSKRRYSESFVLNCLPSGAGDWLWARHRIYYKKSNGSYKKQFEGKVKPGTWQAKKKGSVKRWRKVVYDDGWNSSPNSSYRYTREGRFRN